MLFRMLDHLRMEEFLDGFFARQFVRLLARYGFLRCHVKPPSLRKWIWFR